ncbi:MAG: metallophosphoesterase family protein [Eubacteriales bacterium]|nr:metallophosphoesterase family protein [Eubacteriales bacterium]
MIYVVSDIHGCYDRYKKLLNRLKLGEGDTLYVLGDVIDRGADGFKILLDMASRPNIVPLLGNHEAMAIDTISHFFESIQSDRDIVFSRDALESMELWFANGGAPSLTDFLSLDEKQMQTVWDYLLSMPLYKELSVGGRQFVLVHGGLENFSPSRPLDDYLPDEILWYRPESDTAYYPDKYVVFGHTPTRLLCSEFGFKGTPNKIVQHGRLIDIDCGCAYSGGRLGCLCLDTLKRIYV